MWGRCALSWDSTIELLFLEAPIFISLVLAILTPLASPSSNAEYAYNYLSADTVFHAIKFNHL
jgi:hypothetical protein